MTYKQEWEEYQKILVDIKIVNAELQIAEAAQNAAMQLNQLYGKQQADIEQLDANIDQLRAEKETAETRKGAFELQFARENPEHAQWLEEKIPPAPESEDNRIYFEKFKAILDLTVHTITGGFNPQIDMIESLQAKLNQSQLTHEFIVESPSKDLKSPQDVLKDEVKKINDGIKDAYEASGKTELPERKNLKSDASVKWENDIYEKGQRLLEEYDRKLAALGKNKTILEKEKDGADEKKLKQLEPMDELMKKEEATINTKLNEGINKFKEEKAALEKAVEMTKHLEGAEREKAIQEQREMIKRQRQLDDPSRKQ